MATKAKKPAKATAKAKAAAGADLTLSASQTIARIREILTRARHKALQTVNAEMVRAYWEVGREIIEEEQRGKERAKYGQQLLEMLSKQLSEDFGKGFTVTNLRYMRLFYAAFPNRHAVRDELSWTHYRLLSSVENEQARSFYMVECIKSNWSTRQLERQIHSLLYERLAKSRDKAGVLKLAQHGAEPFSPSDLVRDPYVLEFTGLPERGYWLESDLEQALIDRLQHFLLELGRDFFFVARQKRITIDGEHYYIDLVLYHRRLRCFVLVDLKTGKLTHQDLGQMQMYVGYYEAQEVLEGENPPVGLILCTSKSATAVQYTLGPKARQIFASQYQVSLPSEEELRRELERERDALMGVFEG